MPVKLIIDCDPGIDDVVALALAARSPELDPVAVTTSYGNATLAATTRNARDVLGLAGRREIAVLSGSDRPLTRPLVTAPETHGPTGVGYAPVPAEQPVSPNPVVLLDLLADLDEPVVLVTLGPLTNLAHAVARDEALVRRAVARHIGMFGNLHERGNTNRWADFNAWCDPEATHRVLRAQLSTEMVGLDVTRRMTIDAAEVERYRASGEGLVRWLGEALRFYVEFHRAQERLDGCVVNDVLPVGELISPGLLRFEGHDLEVDLDDGEHRGHTRIAHGGVLTRVAMDVDIPVMHAWLGRVFA